MKTQALHHGGLLSPVHLVVADLSACQKFYAAVFDALGIPMGGAGDGFFWAEEFFVSTLDNPAAKGVRASRHHLAFQTRDRAMVDMAHKAALASGGTSSRAPGERFYNPYNYAAFVLDPAGNELEIFFRGDTGRSAISVSSNIPMSATAPPIALAGKSG